jgi:hypothetical protein
LKTQSRWKLPVRQGNRIRVPRTPYKTIESGKAALAQATEANRPLTINGNCNGGVGCMAFRQTPGTYSRYGNARYVSAAYAPMGKRLIKRDVTERKCNCPRDIHGTALPILKEAYGI